MGDFEQFDQNFAMMQNLFWIVFVVVAAVVVVQAVRGVVRGARNQVAPEVSAQVAIVDKRVETRGGGETQVTQTHYVAFEQPGGERFELKVPASEYGLLTVGDRGAVGMKGTRYLGFTRELLR